MLTYRTFRNTDPPAITALWRSRAGQPGLVQPVTVDLLEQLVFSRLYFDYGGLVLAYDDGQPLGFAHAGFGPNLAANWISTEAGVTCVVLTRPDCPAEEAAAGLLDRCEEHLRGRDATVLYGGGSAIMDPFYRGLYGGSDLPGVLDSDAVARQALACARLSGSRTHRADAAGAGRLPIAHGPATATPAAANGGRGDLRRADRQLLGGGHAGAVRFDAL